MSKSRARATSLIVLAGAFVVVGASVPFMGAFYLQVTIDVLINLIIVASFRFITTMGRWSFAHVALAGEGGFASAILTTQHHFSFWLSMEMGGLCAAALGLVLSYPTLRTSGFYFFMSTFAAGALIVWSWTTFIVPFGGINGLYGVPPPDPISFPGLPPLGFDTPVAYAELVAVITVVSLAVLLRLEQTRFGAVLKAIRSGTPLAMSLGINVRRYETIAFVVGCFFAGIAGALFVHNEGIANATDFGTTQSITIVMFTVVGGAGSFWGPPLGTVVMTVIGQAAESFPEFVQYIPLVYGVITILIVLAFPEGLVGMPERARRAIVRVRRLDRQAEPGPLAAVAHPQSRTRGPGERSHAGREGSRRGPD